MEFIDGEPTVVTYEAARSNAEKIADEEVKARVLRGIDEVVRVLGPDAFDTIDPTELLMDSANQCVLGQAFEHHIPTEEQWLALPPSFHHFAKTPYPAGYFKGLAIIDGDVPTNPAYYGFDIEGDVDSDGEILGITYDDLNEAWQIVLGAEDPC